MDYIRGDSREQLTLLPESLDDFIDEHNPVRFIDVFVDRLDLGSLGFTHAELKDTGRPPYDPADLLKIYIYGAFHKVRSSRALAREAHKNIEMMWLIRRIKPDFRTISDFRKDNKKAIQRVCGEFITYARMMDLFGGELVSIDGSKFKASNSMKKNVTQARLKMLLRKAEEEITSYLKRLDDQDEQEQDLSPFLVDHMTEKEKELTALMDARKETEGRLLAARKRKENLNELQDRIANQKDPQISFTDPDARKMKSRSGPVVGYNIQTAVDAKNKLIAAYDVSQDRTDQHQLSNMAAKAMNSLQVEETKVVADKGYFREEEISRCVEIKAEPYVPDQKRTNQYAKFFQKEKFRYCPENDTYKCPAGKTLRPAKRLTNSEVKSYKTKKCKSCKLKSKCTPSSYRSIRRSRHADNVDLMNKRLQENPEIMNMRKALSEHPFGVIKQAMGFREFLTRGIQSVKTEISLAVLAFNLKRATNTLGVPTMLQSI